jgi:CRP/FNR family cyclic AMP-dependent transcriptional regulator
MSIVNDAVERALASSFWSKVPRALIEPLFAEGQIVPVKAGLMMTGSDTNLIALVLGGFFRMFVRSKSGRQVTVSYAREGDTLGITSALGGPCTMGLQALSDGAAWAFTSDVLQRHCLADARLAWAVACESARRTHEMAEELADNAFGTVRQRVARHLLDLVIEGPDNGGLLAPISQQDLANAVGTVREVVSRVLVAFKTENVLRTTSAGIEVLDATRLYEQSQIAE